jgi:hypothetical protein
VFGGRIEAGRKKAGRGVSCFHPFYPIKTHIHQSFIPSPCPCRLILLTTNLHPPLKPRPSITHTNYLDTTKSRLHPKHSNVPSRVRPQGFVSQVTPPPIATCPLDRLRLNRDLDCTRDRRQLPASSCTAVAEACNNNIHTLLLTTVCPCTTNSTPL